MRSFPPVPDVEDAPKSLFGGGHLWLQEWVPGGLLRFRLQASGLLQFGDDQRVFDDGTVPPGYQHAVAHVRNGFDRQRLRDALDDVSEAVFFGVATRNEGVEYDWERTPSFLGVDVWTPDGGFRPPDAAEALFGRLGLTSVNAVAKEVRADSFDPASYEFPASKWRDGPAAGVLVRNKTGDCAKLLRDWERPAPYRGAVTALVDEVVTEARVEAAVEHLEQTDGTAEVATVTDRVVAVVAREAYARAFDDVGKTPASSSPAQQNTKCSADGIDEAAFRSGAAERVSRLLGGRDGSSPEA
jgi:hypothetical protein